ncbi:L10-interacting MYB domain-containing protein [Cinnamomum micranthum f. kanehirae]|uniref:L10-interacting MYB domain-containing protein n=1 Tax=Cinnamomum micranthum f. kanehirae TaxID=337451 RepID=A0A3S3QV24_9MAGN|nr:L10-interacting MYB domain-containing protein [Cinnamomum micranthum f. kanehirae]
MTTQSNSQGPRSDKSSSKNIKWPTRQDEMLIYFMREQCKEGKSIPGGFTTEGWSEITKQMKTQFSTDFNKDKLKNHFKSFKKWYSVMKTLLNWSGFGWDVDTKMAHPDATMYRLKRLPDYFHLAEIFGDSIADGRAGFALNDPQTPPQDNGGEDEIDVNVTQDEVGEDHVSSRKRRNAALGGSSRQMTKRQCGGDCGGKCWLNSRCTR